MAGNLLIYGGPAVFNGYSHSLHAFGPLLKVAEYTLLAVFVVHIWLTAQIVVENIKARGGMSRYAVGKPVGRRSLATRFMPVTGTYILLFVLWHLYDFTFTDPNGPRSTIAGKSFGLYGVVVNSFKDPFHSILYVVAMFFLALHLAHGVESCVQTMGLKNKTQAAAINTASRYFALLIALGFSSIPFYVFFILK